MRQTKKEAVPSEVVFPLEREKEFRFVSDIDDLLADSWSDYIPRLNEHFGTNLTEEETVVFGFFQNVPQWRQFGEELSIFRRSCRSDPDFVQKHKVIEGSLEGILALTKIDTLIAYITTRPESVRQATVEWLKTNGFPEAPVICLPDHLLLTPQEGVWKREEIEKSGAHLVLEDNIWFAESLSVETIIIERPHNKLVTPKGKHITKVPHWRHVPGEVRRIKEERLKKK